MIIIVAECQRAKWFVVNGRCGSALKASRSARSDKTLAVVTVTRCERVTPMIKDCQIELNRRDTRPLFSCSFIYLCVVREQIVLTAAFTPASSLFAYVQ